MPEGEPEPEQREAAWQRGDDDLYDLTPEPHDTPQADSTQDAVAADEGGRIQSQLLAANSADDSAGIVDDVEDVDVTVQRRTFDIDNDSTQPIEQPTPKAESTPESPDDIELKAIRKTASNVVRYDGGLVAIACAHPDCEGNNAPTNCLGGFFEGENGFRGHFRANHLAEVKARWGEKPLPTVEKLIESDWCSKRMLTEEDKQVMIGGERPGWLVRKAKRCQKKTDGDPSKRKRRSKQAEPDTAEGLSSTHMWSSTAADADKAKDSIDGTPTEGQAPKKKKPRKAKKTTTLGLTDDLDPNLANSLAGSHNLTPDLDAAIDPKLQEDSLPPRSPPLQSNNYRYATPSPFGQAPAPTARMGFAGFNNGGGVGGAPYYR